MPPSTSPVGLVTGFEPFAGMASNPSADLLPALDGHEIAGVRIAARRLPVSAARTPNLVRALVAECRPSFVLGLGLATGAPVLRVERLAINAARFSVADNDGATPDDEPFDATGPTALRATWDAPAVVEALLDAGLPAAASWHAGTHLCNMTLFTLLKLLPATVPCGFLHLPCTPEQAALALRGTLDVMPRPRELPSMPLAIQIDAVRIALGVMARDGHPQHARHRGP